MRAALHQPQGACLRRSKQVSPLLCDSCGRETDRSTRFVYVWRYGVSVTRAAWYRTHRAKANGPSSGDRKETRAFRRILHQSPAGTVIAISW